MSKRHALSWMDDRIKTITLKAVQKIVEDGYAPSWINVPADSDIEKLRERLGKLLSGDIRSDERTAMIGTVEDSPIAESTVDKTEWRLIRMTDLDPLAMFAILATIATPHEKVESFPITGAPARSVSVLMKREAVAGPDKAVVWFRVTTGPMRREAVVLTMGADGMIGIDTSIGRDVLWRSGNIIVQRRFPEVMKMNLEGNRLSKVLTHPVLDELDLGIESVEDMGKNETIIRTNHKQDRIGLVGCLKAG